MADGGGPLDGGGGQGGQDSFDSIDTLALGAAFSCATTLEGDVYCWGDNGQGQLGGQFEDGLEPHRVSLPGPVTLLAAGTSHACAVVVGAGLYCWGRNAEGQLGSSSFEEIAPPAPVEGLPLATDGITSLALGERHSCAVGPDPEAGSTALYCWGEQSLGQTGPLLKVGNATPKFVAAAVTEVTAGAFHTCFELGEQVWCMGENGQFQCGIEGESNTAEPRLVELGANATGISSGRGNHTCVWGGDFFDTVSCWGDNDAGQLGSPFSESELPISGALGFRPPPTMLGAGFAFTCALFGGEVGCWGSNTFGQLGTGGADRSQPVQLPNLSGTTSIAVGNLHACAILTPNEVYCWGGNDFGQLGDRTTTASAFPVRVQLLE